MFQEAENDGQELSSGPDLLRGFALATVALGCAALSAALVIGLGSALQHRADPPPSALSAEAILVQANH